MKNVRIVILIAMACFLSRWLLRKSADRKPSKSWRNGITPVAPFRIIGNMYYVGASDVTSYLVVTPDGDILLDGGLAQTAPQIEANVKTLGFKLSDVKILLNSHAHLIMRAGWRS